MRKRLLTTALAIVAVSVAGTASATQSRINSMGGGVKNFTIVDDSNIFFLPAELVKWGQWAAIQVGGGPGAGPTGTGAGPAYTSFGFHYNFTPKVVLALYGFSAFNEAVTIPGVILVPAGTNADINTANPANPVTGHKLTALLGLDLGTTRLGFLLGFWGAGLKTEDANGKVTNEGPFVIDFGVGLGLAAGRGDVDLGLNVRVGIPGDEQPDSNNGSEGLQFDIGLLFRGTFPFSGPHELVPFAKIDFVYAKHQENAQNSTKLSGLDFAITAGMDIRLNLGDGIIVQPGFGIYFKNRSVTSTPNTGNETVVTDRDIVVPFYNVAVDVKVLDWLDIRFGGGQMVRWVMKTTDNGTNTTKSTKPEVIHKISSGVGFNLPAGVSIDIDVNTAWWQKGPYLLTGDGGPGAFGLSAALSKDW